MVRGAPAVSDVGVCTRPDGLRTPSRMRLGDGPVHAVCAFSNDSCRSRSRPVAAVHTGSESEDRQHLTRTLDAEGVTIFKVGSTP